MTSPRLTRYPSCQQGYTLIELVMIILIVGMIAMYGIITFGNTREQRDASMIQSAQASLQAIVSQGATRFDIRPEDLPTNSAGLNAVITAINGNLGSAGGQTGEVFFSAGQYPFRLNFSNSDSWATFQVQPSGDVVLVSVSANLTLKGYQIQNGVLVKH